MGNFSPKSFVCVLNELSCFSSNSGFRCAFESWSS